MALKSDNAFAELLAKHDLLDPRVIDGALAAVDEVLALGLRVPLARVLRERKHLSPATVERVLTVPMSDKKRVLLVEQLRWLKESPPEEDPKIPELGLQCGLITILDLQEARALQAKVRALGFDKRPLEILIETRKLLPEAAVALFDQLRSPDAAVFTRADLAFCTVASSSRAVPPLELQAAIAVQRKLCARTRIGRPVGEILMAMGKIPAETLQTVVEVVRAQCPQEPPHRVVPIATTRDQDRKIAELVQRGWIALPQVDESRLVLEEMQALGMQRKLGEVIAARGVIALDQLDALYAVAKAAPEGPPALPPAPVTMEPLSDDAEGQGSGFAVLEEDDGAGGGAVLMDPLPEDEEAGEDEPVLMEPLPDEVLQADPPSGRIRGGGMRRPVTGRRRRPRRRR